MAPVRSWLPGLATAVVLLAALAFAQLLPRISGDFDPFTMKIEVYNTPYGAAQGVLALTGTDELHYTDHSNWTVQTVGDAYVYACRDGLYGHFDEAGVFHSGSIKDAFPCPAPGRWIAYGWARSVPWDKTVSGQTVTYQSEGERVVFDLTTGLPVLYEAGASTGALPAERIVYTLVK